MVMMPNAADRAADRKAAAWVHTAAPEDDYLPGMDTGSSDREVLAGQYTAEELAGWIASEQPAARRSPGWTRTVRRRDGRVGRIPTTLTIEEFNEKHNVAPVAAP